MKILLFFAIFAAAAPLWAQDAGRGKLLYETRCATCHTERLHDRARTKIRDLEDLRAEAAYWGPQTKRPPTPDELADIVEYLNVSHYRIGLPANPIDAGQDGPRRSE